MLWWKLQRIKSRDPKTRCRMIEEMAAKGEATAFDAIAEAMSDDESEVRLSAARALGVLRDERALGPLLSALKDRKPDVRAAAVMSLRVLGDKRAVDQLKLSLEDPDHSVR